MINDQILIYILLVNIFTLFAFGMDKYKAIKSQRRVPESSLHSYSFLGGIIGGILGMLLFRHKINKLKFVSIQVIIFVFWMGVFIMWNLNYI